MMNEKVVLMDVDGVILNYPDSFDEWVVKRHNLTRSEKFGLTYDIGEWYNEKVDIMKLIIAFGETVYAGNLSPYRDVIAAMDAAYIDFDVKFTLVTKFGVGSMIKQSRMNNLARVLNRHMVADVIFVGLHQSKHDALEPWRDSGMLFVEDYYTNALDAISMGIDGRLIKRSYVTEEYAASKNIPFLENGDALYAAIKTKYD